MKCQKKTGRYPSSASGEIVTYYMYVPETESVRGIVQIVHGMSEYVERYEPFIEYLLDARYIVCGEDHLGHGKSVKSEDDLGYIPGKDGWTNIVKDMHTLTVRMKQLHPGLPYFMIGHSMGSFLARIYMTKYGKELDGVIISGTAAGDAGMYTLVGLGLVKLVEVFKGRHYISPMLAKVMFGGYNEKIHDDSSPFAWLSVNKANVEKYEADPLCGFPFTTSGTENLIRMLRYIGTESWPKQVPADMPILIISGDQDPVGDMGKGPKIVADKLKAAGVQDAELKLYEGDRHEILNENDKAIVWDDCLTWLNKRAEAAR